MHSKPAPVVGFEGESVAVWVVGDRSKIQVDLHTPAVIGCGVEGRGMVYVPVGSILHRHLALGEARQLYHHGWHLLTFTGTNTLVMYKDIAPETSLYPAVSLCSNAKCHLSYSGSLSVEQITDASTGTRHVVTVPLGTLGFNIIV